MPAAGPQATKKVEKREPEKREADTKSTERQFLEIFDELLRNVSITETVMSKQLVDFLIIFKQIQSKDFFSDEMATALMRELYLDTEEPDQKILD